MSKTLRLQELEDEAMRLESIADRTQMAADEYRTQAEEAWDL
jgi:hypothetical protein